MSALWQHYLEKVDPSLKIFDISTVQHLFISSIPTEDVPKDLQSLKSAILYGAASSMQRPLGTACQIADALMKTHSREFEDSLAASRFLMEPTMIALQALTIYLTCGRSLDPKYTWSMTAILVRLAMSLKLHRDPESQGMPFSDREYRRRLWWHICTLDAHTAVANKTDPIIYERQCTTRVPEWSTDPACPAYLKDMFYSAVRSEVTYYSRTVIFSDQFMQNNGYPVLPNDGKICIIEALADTLKEKYFKRVDRTLPTYTLALISSKITIAELKLAVLYQDDEGESCMNDEVDQILRACVEIMEGLRTFRADPSMSTFAWLWQSYADWDAAGICLSVLTRKIQCSSEMKSRAFSATESFFDSWAECLFEPSRQEEWKRLNHLRTQADVPQVFSTSKAKSRHSKVYTLGDASEHLAAPSPPLPDARRSMTLPVQYTSFSPNMSKDSDHSSRPKKSPELESSGRNWSLPNGPGPKGDEMHFDLKLPNSELHAIEVKD
jgi:hypothetical protein